MKPLYNGMLPPSLVRRLADLWPEATHVVVEYGLKLGNANPAQIEAYLRAHAAEIEAFAASGERYREV